MNAKMSLFVISVTVIIYLLLYNLHDFSFKFFLRNLIWDYRIAI